MINKKGDMKFKRRFGGVLIFNLLSKKRVVFLFGFLFILFFGEIALEEITQLPNEVNAKLHTLFCP